MNAARWNMITVSGSRIESLGTLFKMDSSFLVSQFSSPPMGINGYHWQKLTKSLGGRPGVGWGGGLVSVALCYDISVPFWELRKRSWALTWLLLPPSQIVHLACKRNIIEVLNDSKFHQNGNFDINPSRTVSHGLQPWQNVTIYFVSLYDTLHRTSYKISGCQFTFRSIYFVLELFTCTKSKVDEIALPQCSERVFPESQISVKVKN